MTHRRASSKADGSPRRGASAAVVTALAVYTPSVAIAQRVDDAAVAELVGCYALEVGEWSVDWNPGGLPSRIELLADLRPVPVEPGILEATGGSSSPGPARSARGTDDGGALIDGFDRWTPGTPTTFTMSGGPLARVDLRFVRRDGEGHRGFAVPNRPDMDAARSGRLPRAPILARPAPCDP